MSIFGQNPADITGAVFKSKNFSDIPDKAAARNNLDVPSKADVLYNSVPIGMILPYWGSVAPEGYLPCSGQTVTSGTFPELVTFLGGGASQVVPDLRGEFLRGWDNGRGVDSGRAVRSSQLDAFQSHGHGPIQNLATGGSTPFNQITAPVSGVGNPAVLSPLAFTYVGEPIEGTNPSYGVPRVSRETRPRNVSVLYCIKAYSSVANYTSSVNIAGLISDYSTLNSAAVKYADFGGSNTSISTNGFQKLPNGLIFQWGTFNPTSGSLTASSFPMAFPAFCMQAVGSCQNIGTAIACTFSFNSTQIKCFQSSGATQTVSWMAIGY